MTRARAPSRARRPARRTARTLAVQPQRRAGGLARHRGRAGGRRSPRGAARPGRAGRLGPAVGAHPEAARRGAAPDEALAAVIGRATTSEVTGRFNLLLTDGTGHRRDGGRPHPLVPAHDAAATACGAAAVLVASEPADDDPGWRRRAGSLPADRQPGRGPRRSLPTPPEVDAVDAERVRHGVSPKAGESTASPDGRSIGHDEPPVNDAPCTSSGTCRADFAGWALRADARAGLTARRSRCRPSGSTTRSAASCSRRSPGCPSTTRPGPSGRSCSPRLGRDRRAQRGGHAGRARLGLVGEDPPADRRAAGGPDAAHVRTGRRQRAGAGGRGHRPGRRVPGAGGARGGGGLRAPTRPARSRSRAGRRR